MCRTLVKIYVGQQDFLYNFTTIHDRKEFARFEQERQKMKFSSHSNPIFKQATTTIQNPLFNKPE